MTSPLGPMVLLIVDVMMKFSLRLAIHPAGITIAYYGNVVDEYGAGMLFYPDYALFGIRVFAAIGARGFVAFDSRCVRTFIEEDRLVCKKHIW